MNEISSAAKLLSKDR